MSIEACIVGCESFQCYFYKWYVYFCDQWEVWSMSPSWESQALPQFSRNGGHLGGDSAKTTNSQPQHMQTRCPRAAARLPVQKQTKLQIKSSISVWSSFTSCLWFKTSRSRNKHSPKTLPPTPPQAIRISKVNKKWYCRAWIAASIPGRILILAPLYQICHLGKLLFPLLSSTVANNFCLHPSCVL